MKDKPFLCKLGLHERYHYLPKVSGDLGEIAIACKRCGFGLQYFTGKWDISPNEVRKGIKKQAEIEYGHVLGMFRGISDPLRQMEMTFNVIKDKFTSEELAEIKSQLDCMREMSRRLAPH